MHVGLQVQSGILRCCFAVGSEMCEVPPRVMSVTRGKSNAQALKVQCFSDAFRVQVHFLKLAGEACIHFSAPRVIFSANISNPPKHRSFIGTAMTTFQSRDVLDEHGTPDSKNSDIESQVPPNVTAKLSQRPPMAELLYLWVQVLLPLGVLRQKQELSDCAWLRPGCRHATGRDGCSDCVGEKRRSDRIRLVTGLSPTEVVNTGATELRIIVPPQQLAQVVSAYNSATRQVFSVGMAALPDDASLQKHKPRLLPSFVRVSA